MIDPIAGTNAARPGNVMIVDDERRIRATVMKALTLEGFSVVEADGAEECLRLLEDGFRGVILMDVMMPGKDGWDLVREIKESRLHKGSLIVMLTALDQPCVRMDGLQELVIDYLTKPFVYQDLVATVSNYLGYLAYAETDGE